MADAAEAGDFERQFGGRDVDAHAADDDRYQFPFAESQTEIIHASHFVPYDVCWRSWWRLRGQRPEKFLVTPVTREASRRPVCGVRGALPRVQAMRGRGSRTTAYCTLSAVAPDQSRAAGTRSGATRRSAGDGLHGADQAGALVVQHLVEHGEEQVLLLQVVVLHQLVECFRQAEVAAV